MNSSSNAPALFRSLIVYAICVPLAMVVGYMVANAYGSLDYTTLGFFAFLVAALFLPMVLRWHYQLLLLSATLPLYLFFIKGSPTLLMAMTVVSLGISILERILAKRHFLSVPAMTWPLVAIAAVVFITAELTGGFGLRAAGSEIYGGKKYVSIFCGILSYFAITARAVPPEKARWYLTLYLIGGLFYIISDLYPFTPNALQFIFLLFRPNSYQNGIELGSTRLAGVGFTGLGGLILMLARHGIRGSLLTHKIWRLALMLLFTVMMLLGGARSSIILVGFLFFFLFFLERLHRTAYLPFFAGLILVGGMLLVPFANKLPVTYQRSLAFLPLDLNPMAVADAEDSSEWRIKMWQDLLPQIPQYLLLGKGCAIHPEDYNEMMGQNIAFHEVDASQQGLALAGDYHNGPLSVVIPFGVWGSLAFLWFTGACCYVLFSNLRYGLPELLQVNRFLLACFGAHAVLFFFVYGAVTNDLGDLAQLVGLSVACNGGLRRAKSAAVAERASQQQLINPRFPKLSAIPRP